MLNHKDKFTYVQSKRNCTRTAPKICQVLNSMRETTVSVSTVKRCLCNYGLKGCVAAKKPLLCKLNKVKRLRWAKKHKDWTIQEWSQILFIDESKFEIFGRNR